MISLCSSRLADSSDAAAAGGAAGEDAAVGFAVRLGLNKWLGFFFFYYIFYSPKLSLFQLTKSKNGLSV